jgi:hypothetical protein
MAAPGLLLGHQPGGLERPFHERVAEAHAVLPPRELMEVPDVDALVAVAIQGEHTLDLRHRGSLGRRRLAAAIEQAIIAILLELPAQTANASGTAPEDVGGL